MIGTTSNGPGAFTVTYNLPGSPRLRMDAELIADLFRGEIATWRDRS